MKIFNTEIIPIIDDYTIINEPVSSLDLMERAANALFQEICSTFSFTSDIFIFCGTGNNGGDGLALSRLLHKTGYKVHCYLLGEPEKLTSDASANYKRLSELISIQKISSELPEIPYNSLVIDALFGSGLNRRIEGLAAKLVRHINASKSTVLSIDMPSGLKGEDDLSDVDENIIHASCTLTLQMPKLSLLFADASKYNGVMRIVPINLHPQALIDLPSKYFYLEQSDIKALLKPRDAFAHKGTFGKVFIAAGSYGMAGAAMLCAKAAYRIGAGLVRVHLPSACVDALQTYIPEAVASIDANAKIITAFNPAFHDAVAAGPGIGTKFETASALKQLLSTSIPMVLDADALNIIASDEQFLQILPKGSILTPHRTEFERLLGRKISKDYLLFMEQLKFSAKYGVILVLKSHHTSITLPDGRAFFNSTGNSGMATAGSGDVLTGVIVGLLAQGYLPADAALVGVYLHGLAGDRAALKRDKASIMASDIVDNLSFDLS